MLCAQVSVEKQRTTEGGYFIRLNAMAVSTGCHG